jgi:predicted metal-binding protein
MDKSPSQTHRLTVCTHCRHIGAPCRPGLELLERLQAALALADRLSDAFRLEGSVCMAGCERPCTVAFQASAKTTYLFGDIDGDVDIDGLVAFAERYRNRPDGLTREGERPGAPEGKIPARIPAAMLLAERAAESLQ